MSSKEQKQLTPSAALYGFMSWLTMLEDPVTLSCRHDAALAVELAGEYMKANGLPDPEGWDGSHVMPDTRLLMGQEVS